MSGNVEAPRGEVHVASAMPGRIRLRAVGPAGRARLATLADEVRAWPEPASVQLRTRSASLVVGFDPDDSSAVAERFAGLGVEPHATLQARPVDPSVAVAGAVGAANRAVAHRLDGTDLRSLVPLGIGLLAARRAVRGGDRLADAPWYVLAWYASETFMKFHPREEA